MKILFLQDDFPPHAKGGAGIVAGSLAEELAKEHEVTVITSVQDKSLAGSFQEKGMRIERVYSDYAQRWRAWRSLYNPSTAGAIKKLLREINPDVVHAHNVHYHLSYWSLRLAKQSGAKVFLTAHDVMLFHYGKLLKNAPEDCGSPRNYRVSAWQHLRKQQLRYNPLRNIVIRFLLRNVDRIFAVSEELKKALQQNGIQGVSVIRNGINADAWRVAPEVTDRFVRTHKLEGKKPILLGGRISDVKGGGMALAALREVVKKDPNAILLFLGRKTPYIEHLLLQANEWSIGENIVCTGWLSGNDLKAAYHAAQVVLVPSSYLDPLPTIVLEAMACGKPVVGSCFGGIPEMIVDGETGYLAYPLDVHDLAQKLKELLFNEKKASALGKKGLEIVQKYFSLKNVSEKLLDEYKLSCSR